MSPMEWHLADCGVHNHTGRGHLTNQRAPERAQGSSHPRGTTHGTGARGRKQSAFSSSSSSALLTPSLGPGRSAPGGEGGKGGRGRHPLHLPGLGSGRRTWGCWPTAKCASRHREVAGKYHLPGRRVARQRDMVREWGAKVDDPTRHAHADPPPSPPDQPTPPPGARSPFRSCLSWRTRPNTALSVYIYIYNRKFFVNGAGCSGARAPGMRKSLGPEVC